LLEDVLEIVVRQFLKGSFEVVALLVQSLEALLLLEEPQEEFQGLVAMQAPPQ